MEIIFLCWYQLVHVEIVLVSVNTCLIGTLSVTVAMYEDMYVDMFFLSPNQA